MDEEIDLRQYFNILLRRRRVVAVVTLAAAVAAFIFSYSSPSIYEAKALVLVAKPSFQAGAPPDPSNPGPKIGTILVSDFPSETLVVFARSPAVTQKLASKFGTVGATSKASRLGATLRASAIRTTNLVELSARGNDPAQVARVANEWAALVTAESQGLFSTEAQQSFAFFDGRMLEARSQLEKAEEAFREFNATSKIGVLQSRLSAITSQIASYQSRLTDLSVTLEGTKTELVQTEVQIGRQPRTLVLSKSITTDPFLHQSASEATNADFVELSKLNLRNEELNPVFVSLDQSRNSLIVQVAALRAQRAKLTQALVQLDAELAVLRGQLASQQQQQTQLVRTVENSKQIYDVLLLRREEARLASASQVGAVKAVASAVVPESPVGPRRLFNVALGAIMGLMAGVTLAFIMEYFGRPSITQAPSPVLTRPDPSPR